MTWVDGVASRHKNVRSLNAFEEIASCVNQGEKQDSFAPFRHLTRLLRGLWSLKMLPLATQQVTPLEQASIRVFLNSVKYSLISIITIEIDTNV